MPEPRVPPTCTHHTSFTPHTSVPINLASSHSLSRHTCNTNNSTRISHINHRIHIGYHDNLTDRPKTTTWPQTQHKDIDPAVKVRELSSYYNINGIKNKLEVLKLLIHDTHAYIITIQVTKLTPKANTPKVHNFTTVRADRLHNAGGGFILLISDNITFTTTGHTFDHQYTQHRTSNGHGTH